MSIKRFEEAEGSEPEYRTEDESGVPLYRRQVSKGSAESQMYSDKGIDEAIEVLENLKESTDGDDLVYVLLECEASRWYKEEAGELVRETGE